MSYSQAKNIANHEKQALYKIVKPVRKYKINLS